MEPDAVLELTVEKIAELDEKIERLRGSGGTED
jgi:hypothetical protein